MSSLGSVTQHRHSVDLCVQVTSWHNVIRGRTEGWKQEKTKTSEEKKKKRKTERVREAERGGEDERREIQGFSMQRNTGAESLSLFIPRLPEERQHLLVHPDLRRSKRHLKAPYPDRGISQKALCI